MSIDAEDRLSHNLRPITQQLDQLLTQVAGKPVAFVLVVFDPDEPEPRVNYSLNVDREIGTQALDTVKRQWDDEKVAALPPHKKH